MVKGSEVLHEPDGAVIFHDGKDGAVVAAAGWLNDSKFEPLKNVSFNFFSVCI